MARGRNNRSRNDVTRVPPAYRLPQPLLPIPPALQLGRLIDRSNSRIRQPNPYTMFRAIEAERQVRISSKRVDRRNLTPPGARKLSVLSQIVDIRRSVICGRRKIRKEVLHALGLTINPRRGTGGGHPKIRC